MWLVNFGAKNVITHAQKCKKRGIFEHSSLKLRCGEEGSLWLLCFPDSTCLKRCHSLIIAVAGGFLSEKELFLSQLLPRLLLATSLTLALVQALVFQLLADSYERKTKTRKPCYCCSSLKDSNWKTATDTQQRSSLLLRWIHTALDTHLQVK